MDWMALADPPTTTRKAEMLVAILLMSNDAERMSDPFTRRIALNEMQDAIQSAKPEIEAIAEGLLFLDDAKP